MDTIGDPDAKPVAKQSRHSDYEPPACPVEATLELIGGKWKGIVLFYLLDGRLRFSELKRKIGCVTQRMLTKQLRELETSGLVNRIVYAEVPPRVEYELTTEGKSLEPILIALKQWGETHAVALLKKRSQQEDHVA
ncbi:transcriptional regulator [Rhodopirellula sp. SM50]|nr:transcriptional regulator [Rhodopirellula sp. SM50]